MKNQTLLAVLFFVLAGCLVAGGCGSKDDTGTTGGDGSASIPANPDQGKPVDTASGKDKDGPIDPKSTVIEPGREPVANTGG
jgi:hypothetical protein